MAFPFGISNNTEAGEGHVGRAGESMHMYLVLVRLLFAETVYSFVWVASVTPGTTEARLAPYIEALKTLKASSRPPLNLASAVFQLMTFQMFST